MQLKTLLAATPVRQVFGSLDRPVENIAYDSRRVQRNTMFVALRGEKTDGHQFIGQAIEKGASVIVAEREQKDPRVTCLVVENTPHRARGFFSGFLRTPGAQIKTRRGHRHKWQNHDDISHQTHLRKRRIALRINRNRSIRDRRADFAGYSHHARIARFTRATGADRQRRVQSGSDGSLFARAGAGAHTRIEWNVAVFTNLTQDHLDFHGTMENYFEAKAKLFTGLAGQKQKTKPVAIVNIDDRYGQQLLGRLDKNVAVITYGMGSRADFRASNYRAEFTGTSYQLDARGKSYLVRLPLIGRFNVTNSIAALAAAEASGN